MTSELIAHGHKLFYYDNRSKGEVDYLIDDYDSLSVVSIEGKSGKDYTVHSALNTFVQNEDYYIKKAFVVSNERNVMSNGKITYIKLLTKNQRRYLSSIRELQKQTPKISKRLGWIGNAISFLGISSQLVILYKSGTTIANCFAELLIELFVRMIEVGAGKIFELIAKYIPYVGFLLGVVAGWVISYLLEKYFTKSKVARIKARFLVLMNGKSVSLTNLVSSAARSLTA